MSLSDCIARNAVMRGDAIATRCAGRTLTYAQFSARSEALAATFAANCAIQPGDRIAYFGANSDEMLVLVFAAARLGAIVVPLNWRLAMPELAYIIDHAAPKLLILEASYGAQEPALRASAPAMPIMPVDCSTHGSGFTPHLVPGKAIQANRMDDPLLLVYTSGTTGRPKGAVLTQAALFANAVNSWHMHGLTAADHILTVLPMFHVGGLNIQTIPALLAGARVTIHDRFSPDATLAALRGEDRPSLLVLVPATMEAVLADPACDRDAFTSLRVLTTGSTIVGETLIERFAKLGVRVIQVYGATETGPIVIYERFDTERHAPGTTGSAGVVNDARIVDDAGRAVPDGTPGEIVVRGPNILSGYWRDTAATEEALRDGWFHTGDIATRDASGHFCVRDRKKNVIISGGENIYPAEIERVLADAPGVAECAVVGRPDDRWQEVPVAFVVATPGVTLDIPALEAHLAANLARFKLPKAIIPRDSLPRNALGKIQHFALKGELYAACAVTERQN